MSIVSKLNNIYKPLVIGSPAFIGGIESTEGQTSIVSVLNFTGVATGTYTIKIKQYRSDSLNSLVYTYTAPAINVSQKSGLYNQVESPVLTGWFNVEIWNVGVNPALISQSAFTTFLQRTISNDLDIRDLTVERDYVQFIGLTPEFNFKQVAVTAQGRVIVSPSSI